ncbi:MAG: hypothetical protein L0312_16795, partial [Acidobacteria bacterium]|nr:hypothetical protein [Acidobacteriota bacterium]
MIDFQYKRLFSQSRHPSLEELLLYLDGEIKPKGHSRIEAHLRICWPCRVQRERIEGLISAFIGDQKTFLSESPSFPERAIPKFETRLRHLATDSRKPPLFSCLFTTFLETAAHAGLLRSLACCVFVLIVATVFIIRLSSVPPVSAQEVLQRSQQAEAQRIRQVSEPVIYQKLRVRRKSASPRLDDVVTWELWNDASNNRFKARIEDASGVRFVLPLKEDARPAQSLRSASLSSPPILAELDLIYRSNHIDRRQPLSPATYDFWRRSIQPQSDKVVEVRLTDGGRALALETTATGPFATNQIIKAELVVRAKDWHPVEQRLRVQGENETKEYELTETTFQLVSLNALSPSIFADVAPPPSPMAIPPVPIASRKPPPSATELTAAEVEAHYALHRLNACLGEPIEVLRDSSDEILVRGLADAEERKKELVAALERIPHVTVSIQTVAEAKAAISSSSHAQDGTQDQEEAP